MRVWPLVKNMKAQKINVTNVLQGSTSDIADQIFRIFIGQVHDNMNKNNPEQALEFAFLVAGKGIAGLLNQVADSQIDDMAKVLHDMVDEVTENLKAIQTKKS